MPTPPRGSGESRAFLTYCWVMVEPPCRVPPVSAASTARAVAVGAIPDSVRKDRFSAAITASRTCLGTRGRGMSYRSTGPRRPR